MRSLFGDVIKDVSAGIPKVAQSDYLTDGTIRIIDQGKTDVAGYTDDRSKLANVELPVILFGDHTRRFKLVNHPFAIGADGVKVLRTSSELDARFAFHFLRSVDIPNAGYSRHFKYLREITVPVPPLPEQRRIASILDQAAFMLGRRQLALGLLDEATEAAFKKASAMSENEPHCLLGDVVSIDAPLVDPRLPAYADADLVSPDLIEKHTGRLATIPPSVGEVKPISGKYRFEAGNVLYSKIRPALNKVLIPTSGGLCNADMYPLRLVDAAITREYLWGELRSDRFLDFAASFANRAQMPKLNRAQLLAYSFPKPTQRSQELFLSAVTALNLIRQLQLEQLKKADELFASLQHCAFSGEL